MLNETDIEAIRWSMASILQINETRVRIVRWTLTPVSSSKRSEMNICDIESEIVSAAPESHEPSPAQAVTNLIQETQNATLAQQLIDPTNSDSSSQLVGITTLPTGSEKEGSYEPIQVQPPINAPSLHPTGITSFAILLLPSTLCKVIFFFWIIF